MTLQIYYFSWRSTNHVYYKSDVVVHVSKNCFVVSIRRQTSTKLPYFLLYSSLRTADLIPVVASLPPKYICYSQANRIVPLD